MITIAILLPIFVVMLVLTGIVWAIYKLLKSSPFQVSGKITVTRDKVHPGQRTDIRLHFYVDNPKRLNLMYEAKLSVEGFSDVERTNTFNASSFSTVVHRLGASWSTLGDKAVNGVVTVMSKGNAHKRISSRFEAEGIVTVISDQEQD